MQLRFLAFTLVMASMAASASADDWMMYRKDAGRLSASADTIKLPLTEAWTRSSSLVLAKPVLSGAVIRANTVYYIAGFPAVGKKPAYRALVAADAKTGQEKWQQPLKGTRAHPYALEDYGPAVTPQGVVYVGNMATVMTPCPRELAAVQAFRSDTGAPIDRAIVPIKDLLSRFFIRDGHGELDHLLVPGAKPSG
jgi:outer membrane protein assembly factor BamB